MSSKDFAYYVKDLPDEDQKALKLSSPAHWLDFTRDFHAEAVRIWPLNGTSRHGGRHWDRALEVAYQPPPAQCGHN